MSYIAVTLNHLRAVRQWALAHEAAATLDMVTMQLEVRARNRYFTLRPRFLARVDDRLLHCAELTDQVTGFIGWLPYPTLRWDLASDKLAFRQHLLNHGLRVPAAWRAGVEASEAHLLKRSMGSFGYAQRGPFRPGQAGEAPPGDRGELFAEQFIAGKNLKLWVWGDHAFYAHLDDYPTLTGDGQRPLAALLEARFAKAGAHPAPGPDQASLQDCLAFQGVAADTVLPEGARVFIDYRYGRLYENTGLSARSDNRLPLLDETHHAQIRRVIDSLTPLLQAELGAPVLYALDGVIDAGQNIWWLEMNSNPILPPEGYASIFSTLFGTPGPA